MPQHPKIKPAHTISTETCMSQEHPADPVLLEQHQGLARITLNRPAKYNALSEEVLDSLQHILDKLAQDPSLQCVIIQAEGKAFCAGHDLKQMRSRSEERRVGKEVRSRGATTP